jgi:hypothetical protein
MLWSCLTVEGICSLYKIEQTLNAMYSLCPKLLECFKKSQCPKLGG